MHLRRRIRLVRDTIVSLSRNMSAHHTMLLASGVAFSCIIGLIPALITIVAVYGLVAEPADVESNLRPLVDALPPDAANLVIGQLQNVTAVGNAQITVGLLVGLIGAAWAVSSAMNSIVMSIRVAHEMTSPHGWLRGRMFALRLSLVAVVATSTMIWLVVVLPPVLDQTNVGGELLWALSIGRWPIVIATSITALALLYRAVVGHRSGRFHAVSVGSVVGTSLWVVSTIGLSLAYDRLGSVESTVGSIGAVGALMAWLYLSALSALIGAEIDGERHRSGIAGEDWISAAEDPEVRGTDWEDPLK